MGYRYTGSRAIQEQVPFERDELDIVDVVIEGPGDSREQIVVPEEEGSNGELQEEFLHHVENGTLMNSRKSSLRRMHYCKK